MEKRNAFFGNQDRVKYLPSVNPAIDFQTRAIRAMTADEKVRVSQALWEETWEVLAAGVRGRNPEWTRAQVETRVRELLRDVRA